MVASDLSTKIRALSKTKIIRARKLKWFQGEYSFLIACKQALCEIAFLILLCLKLTMTLSFCFRSQIVVLHRPVERRGLVVTCRELVASKGMNMDDAISKVRRVHFFFPRSRDGYF